MARLGWLCLVFLCGCATLAPSLEGVYIARGAEVREASGADAAVALVGDIGVAREKRSRRLARQIARRLSGAPQAPVLVLGDVFYGVGLVGTCPADGSTSRRGCSDPGAPEAQFESVLGPYRDALSSNPVIGIPGNHDHYGGEQAVANACDLMSRGGEGWRYLAKGCGLDEQHPIETIDLGAVVVFALDSEPMIRDGEFRRASIEALRAEIQRYRTNRPNTWRVVAAHHPIETYGKHNGASFGTALLKDWYWLLKTVLYPFFYPVERVVGQQDVYQLRYRAFRRELYRMLRDEPVDLFVAGHDHSLQHVEIDHPGVRHQVVSGAGAYRTPVKRFGLDLLWTDRLARLLSLGDALPAPSHELQFGFGGDYDTTLRSGRGFAVLVPEGGSLVVEFYDAASDGAIYVTSIRR
jgi:hypothetical protein